MSRKILFVNCFRSSEGKPSISLLICLHCYFFHFTNWKFVYQLFVNNQINLTDWKTMGRKVAS